MVALSDYKVLTFDCYGTLIDWESGIWDALQPLIAANGTDDVTRRVALEAYARVESEVEEEAPGLLYADVLERVHARVARHLGFSTTTDLDRDFASSIGHWPAFPDSADALRRLKRHYQLVILSNVHRDGIAASIKKLGVAFDAVYTAQDIGHYKPSRENFEYLLRGLRDDLGLDKRDVLHTAQSLYHDHVPAKAIGLATAWIDRQHLSEGGNWGATASVAVRPETDFVFFTLGEMAEAASASR